MSEYNGMERWFFKKGLNEVECGTMREDDAGVEYIWAAQLNDVTRQIEELYGYDPFYEAECDRWALNRQVKLLTLIAVNTKNISDSMIDITILLKKLVEK